MTQLSNAVLLLAFTTSLGCSADEASVATETVVATAGGTVTLDAAKIEIPANALPTDTDVSLALRSAYALADLPGAVGDALTIEPVGVELLIPASVTLQISGNTEDAPVEIHVLEDHDWISMDASAVAEPSSIQFSISRFGSFAPAVRVPDIADGGNRIEGTVTWGNGDPVADVDVDVFQHDSKLTTVSTDDAGQFSLVDVTAGIYVLTIDFECAATAEVTVTDDTPGVANMVLCE